MALACCALCRVQRRHVVRSRHALGAREVGLDAGDLGTLARRGGEDERNRGDQKKKEIREGMAGRHGILLDHPIRPVGGDVLCFLPRISPEEFLS